MCSSKLVDGESHAIGRFRQSAAAVHAAGRTGICHRYRCRTRSCNGRSWNVGRQLGSAHSGGGLRRAVPIDGRIARKAGTVNRKYEGWAT